MEAKKYRVRLINGDYAELEELSTGEPITVAMALLPEETDEGGTLIYKDLMYTYIE